MFRKKNKRIRFHAYLNNSTNVSTKTVTNAMERVFNGLKDKYASLCAGVHVRVSVWKPFFRL